MNHEVLSDATRFIRENKPELFQDSDCALMIIGSHVKGRCHENSDVDIFAVHNHGEDYDCIYSPPPNEIALKEVSFARLQRYFETNFIISLDNYSLYFPLKSIPEYYTAYIKEQELLFSDRSTHHLLEHLAMARRDVWWVTRKYAYNENPITFRFNVCEFAIILLQVIILANKKPYPYRKWLMHEATGSDFGKQLGNGFFYSLQMLFISDKNESIQIVEELYAHLLQRLDSYITASGDIASTFSLESYDFVKYLPH